jgi:predicted Zn-dependent protease
MGLIQPILEREPNNVAAIHYWIHATEMAGKPELALAPARRLADLAPKASHLVHMASHTYLKTGYYEDAAATNARAIGVDTAHADKTNLFGALGSPDYYGHNLAMGLEGAMMSGDGKLALKFADDAPIAFAKNDYVTDRTYAAYGRYAPDRALALKAPSGDDFGTVMWRYARGEAYAAKGDAAGLRRESEALAALLKGKTTINEFQMNQVRLARLVLDGRIAMLAGQPAEAVRLFREAADAQEGFDWGADPPPWWYPVRRSLAAAELKLGKPEDAAKEARASLAKWPRDGLALQVLGQAQTALRQTDEARHTSDEARKLWRGKPQPLDLI